MAYLTANKKAEIVEMYHPTLPKSQGINYLLDEVGNAIAAHKSATVADLDQTIAADPTQAEVQAISDKVDELLAAMRAAGLMATE